MAIITPIAGQLGKANAAHLLRRTTFGLTMPLVDTFATKTITQAIDLLLVVDTSTDKPLNEDASGTSFIDTVYDALTNAKKMNYSRSFWYNKMLKDNTAFFKTVLFWNNHFAIGGSGYIKAFKYYKLLQQHALGNFRTFVIEMTKEPYMLSWLNGDQNQKGANNIPSNENYARELQELFMIGEAEPDGTPNYTENDVREAARVLTGWQIVNSSGNITDLGSKFTLSRHDIGNKTFSANYGNKTITGQNNATAGTTELEQLVDMILEQPESAYFICRKIYQWFVAAPITAEIEMDIIRPLATTFRANNYEIKPVIAQLLSSEHFFSESIKGAIIKHPLDLMMNMYRFVALPIPDPTTQTLAFYSSLERGIRLPAANMKMEILNHPTVFGWDAYYQAERYKLWINGTSLRLRNTEADLLVTGFTSNAFKTSFNALTLTEQVLAAVGYTFANKDFPDATDTLLSVKIIEGYCFYLYPKSCTATEIESLREILLLQCELNEIGFWFEWKYYKDGDTAVKNGITTKLANLIRYFWKSPEFQLI